MEIKNILTEIFTQKTLILGVLSQPRERSGSYKIQIRPLLLQSGMVFQVTEEKEQKAFHTNISPEECLKRLIEEWVPLFKQGTFFTTEADYHLTISKKYQLTVKRKKPTKSLNILSHNRSKSYLLEEGIPVPFLIELGVMASSGKIIADKFHKFRQINRFLEFIEDIIPHLDSNKRIRIIDFGSGKAYLTFALYHYLRFIKGFELDITGLDLKADVVAFCQNMADKLEWQGLKFIQGDIDQHEENSEIDLVVSLHACDTATDAALEKAVRWGARVILAVPCCQHELFSQVDCEPLRPLLRQGILKERFAALATDAARVQILSLLGYQTHILEFIDLEHTPKNLLIRAIKRTNPASLKTAKEEYSVFKKMLNIEPSLETRFKHELSLI